MENDKSLNCIDVTKLIMSFCVIGIHSYIFDKNNLPSVIDFFVNLAVPFFIITSGWLYSRNYGLETNELGKISFRYIKLYVLWIIV
jgi:surface polysaccharide O-acyltransferase-like enzyme